MNKVYIGVSIDGYIADRNGGLEWLEQVPNPDNNSMGYEEFMSGIDALVMGKNTFETVLGFGGDWPYTKPVFVLSTTLQSVPVELENRVFIVNGTLKSVINEVHNKGYHNLYIDGGRTIQSFLKEDLIDEIITSTIPVLLGGGSRLFGDLTKHLEFELASSTVLLNQIVQTRFIRGK